MELNIVTIEDLNLAKNEIIKIISEQIKSQKKNQSEYIKAKEVKALLKISDNTLRSLIISNKISRTKIGSSYYFSLTEIQNLFLPSNEK